MIRLIISMAILFGAAACASSPPPAQLAAADTVATANTSNEAVAGSEATAGAKDEESTIESVEAPQVALTSAPVPEAIDELVCHRERVTGTHRMEKICRYRSEMDRTREETQRALRKMDRQTSASSPSN